VKLAPGLRHGLVDAGYALGWTGLRNLPEGLGRRQFQLIGEYVYRRNGKGIRRLRANLTRVLATTGRAAEVEQVTRAGVSSYFRYWYETFRLPELSGTEILQRFDVDNFDRLRGAYEAGTGLVLALTHSGNWDLAGAWLTRNGIPFTTVVERLEPERLFRRFVAFRESFGMEVIPTSGSDRPPSALLAERLQRGACLCLLADRDLTSTGVPVDFFGATAKFPGGPARLALQTGAPLMPVGLWFDGPRHGRAVVHPPIPPSNVESMTQSLAGSFAEDIAKYPQDWHMLQRVWVD
jgi:lauroyl/myristoyl acyltransferase